MVGLDAFIPPAKLGTRNQTKQRELPSDMNTNRGHTPEPWEHYAMTKTQQTKKQTPSKSTETKPEPSPLLKAIDAAYQGANLLNPHNPNQVASRRINILAALDRAKELCCETK